MKRRKTKAEKDHEWAEAERRCWEQFRPRLEAAQTLADALMLVADTVPRDTPGRKYYSNLGFFLQTFVPPAGSSYGEKALYIQLIQRFDKAGLLKPGAREKAEEDLRRAMEAQGNW